MTTHLRTVQPPVTRREVPTDRLTTDAAARARTMARLAAATAAVLAARARYERALQRLRQEIREAQHGD